MIKSSVLMLGTHLETKGGISSVVNVYKTVGLFEKWNVKYIPTSCDGPFLKKLYAAFRSLLLYITGLFTRRVVLVHVHTASRTSFWRKLFFILLAFSMKVPVILHLHGGEFHLFYEKECSEWKRKIIRYTFERSSRVLVLSNRWYEWVKQQFPYANVIVVYNPVILTKQLVPDIRDKATVLFMGRLGEGKGTFDLIDSVSRLLPSYSNIKLLLAGDGALEESKLRSQKLGVEPHVQILGWIVGSMKKDLFSQSTILALPSYNEGLPMSVLEAMAAGLPVVSTRVGGIPEAITNGVEGFLIEPGDVEALSKCIGILLSDRNLQHQMGKAGRKKVEISFSADKIVLALEKLYSELGARPRI